LATSIVLKKEISMDAVNMVKGQTPVPTLTTNSGSPVEDNQNRITAGPRGPELLQDYRLLEKVATFNRERIPERIVHAKGSAAHGTVAGERGAADAERDVRDDNDEYMQAGNLIGVLTIGIATMLSLVLLQLITAGP
jgi:hypothetical protein